MISANSNLFLNYSNDLVSRVFKILPLYEEKNEGVYTYVQSLVYELSGLAEVVEGMSVNEGYLSLLATLESISDDTLFLHVDNHSVIKREVFRCIDVIKKMREAAEGSVIK